MKVYCTICCKEWDASKYIHASSYICPHCDWKIKRNIPIKLGRREKYCKKEKMDKKRRGVPERKLGTEKHENNSTAP